MMATPQQLRQRVEWRDLIQLNKKEILIELLLPLPWLSAFLFCALQQWYVFALAFSFMFFLTAGRLSHGAIHGSLGIRRGINDTVIFICSLFCSVRCMPYRLIICVIINIAWKRRMWRR